MNFNTIVEDKLIEYSKSTIHQLDIMLKHYPKSEIELNIIKREYLFLDVERLFIFKQKNYDNDVFYELKTEFMEHGLPNEECFFEVYKKNYVESILILYLFKLTKELSENKFWSYINYILKRSNLYVFLNMFTFIGDYELHSKILFLIDNRLSKYFFSLIYTDKLNINNLKAKLFLEYFNHGMIESCELILKKYPKLKYSDKIQFLCNTTIHNQSSLNKFAILSNIIGKHLYSTFFTSFFNNAKKCHNIEEELNINKNNMVFTNDQNLKNILFYSYKNTISEFINNDNTTNIDLDIFIQIYCYCYDLFLEDKEHNLKFLNFINTNISKGTIKIFKYNFYLSDYLANFTFLCIKQKYPINISNILLNTHGFPILVQKDNEYIKSVFNVNLIKYILFFDNEDYHFFQSIIQESFTKEAFDKYCLLLRINEMDSSEFEQLFIKLYHLDMDVFYIILSEYHNDPIIDKIHSKIQINNF